MSLSHRALHIAAVNTALLNKLSRELGISKVLAQLLINRNLTSANEAEKFLKVSTKNFLDPYSFSDMRKAVGIVKKALAKKDKVLVFGDYDADGITALTIVKETLKKIGVDASHYLPHRIKEGYGLAKNIMQIATQKGIKVLITVDCGISNREEIKELKKNGVEVIVTDHHEPGKSLPQADSIINPKVGGCGYKYRDLAGVGVAFKFCQALTGEKLLEDLDLVSLGTIADVVPLTGENRIIAKEGLARLKNTKRVGLRALIDNSRIGDKKFTSQFISFILGPRLNASGRMDTADLSVDLLMSNSASEADKLAKILEAHNRMRQKIEGKILEEAQDLINREVNFKEHKIIVVAKEDWHQGVLGIVASKLADRFYRPTIIISKNSKACKGSGRSIKNFHLFQALLECSEFLQSFGGHAHAAGLVIKEDRIEDFKISINRLACDKLSLHDLIPGLDIDLELALSDLNEEIILELGSLEPFGTANPEPLFLSRNLKLKGQPQILSRETIKFWATEGTNTFQVIGFGMSSVQDSLTQADAFDLVYTPRMDAWAGEESVLLEAKDIFFK